MVTNTEIHITMVELCQITREELIELVEQGILEPSGTAQDDWIFDVCATGVAKKACRLRQDLDIDWHGIALVLDLLDKLEQLDCENKMLKQRLNRFMLE